MWRWPISCVRGMYKKGTLICRGSTRVYPVESFAQIFSWLLYSSYYKRFSPLNSSNPYYFRTRMILTLELLGFPWRHGHGRTQNPATKMRKQKRRKEASKEGSKQIDMFTGMNSSLASTDSLLSPLRPPRFILHLRWQPTRSFLGPRRIPRLCRNMTVVSNRSFTTETHMLIIADDG